MKVRDLARLGAKARISELEKEIESLQRIVNGHVFRGKQKKEHHTESKTKAQLSRIARKGWITRRKNNEGDIS